VAGRILRTYGRDSRVVYPPVDVEDFSSTEVRKRHYLAGGRMVRYKNLERAVEAANQLSLPLIVFGDGPDMARLKRLGGPTVDFIGSVSSAQLADLISHSYAFLFPGVEDFGILPVEVQAGGCPVIALAQGGVLETVRQGETGLLYEDDSLGGLLDAIYRFEKKTFDPIDCVNNAVRFNRARFEQEISETIHGIYRKEE